MTRKILIVDDSKFSRNTIKKHLSTLGYEAFCEATDGEDGLKKAKELKPSLIISDIEMPNKNGIEMIKEIKKTDTQVRFIVITSLVNAQIMHEVARLGAPIIKKPISVDFLKNALAILEKNS